MSTPKAKPGEHIVRMAVALIREGQLATREGAEVLGRAADDKGKRAARDALNHLREMGIATKQGKGRNERFVLDPLVLAPNITWVDRLALRVGRDAVSFLRGTLLGDGLDKAAGDDAHWQHLDRKVVHRPEPEPRYEDHQEVLDNVVDALMRQRLLDLTYSGRNGPRDHQSLRPLTLVVYRRALYLLADQASGGPVLRLRVDRMLNADVTRVAFDYPESWDPEAELAPWFGMIAGDRVDTVVLRFSAQVARHVQARSWHPTARLDTLDDGSVMLTMQTGGRELVRFALEWGRQCEVVAPAWLREAVAAERPACPECGRPPVH